MAAAAISGLSDILNSQPKDLPLRLRSAAARAALRRLLDLLHSGASNGFEAWTAAQIAAVAAIAKLVVAAVARVSVWQVEGVVLKVVEKSIEFCLACLEKSAFEEEDFGLQEGILDLLELALIERAIEDQDSMCFGNFSSLVEQTPTISVKQPGEFELNDNSTLGYQVGSGLDYLKGQNLVKSILPVSYDHTHSVSIQPHTLPANLRSSDSVFFSVRQSVIVHLKILPCLLRVSRKLLQPSASFDEQMNDPKFGLRLTFSLKVVDLLKHLVKELARVALDVELLHAIAEYADTLPSLFEMRLDIVNNDLSIKGNKYGSLLFQLLEEFLQFVQVVCYDGVIMLNIRVCILASLLDILDSKIWRYERASSSLRPPVVYCPEIALFLLNLLKDAKSWLSQSHDSKAEAIMVLTDQHNEVESGMPQCHVHGEKVLLTKRLTFEKYLELIFPQSVQWIDNLIHLAFFLHSEVAKSALIIEKSHISSTKPVVALDLDSTSLHEEDALFGNLFSEVTRPVGATDGFDQSTAVVSNVSRNPDLPTQAVTELLMFLRQCIFSPDWSSSKFGDACRKLGQNHFKQLLSILNCRAFIFGEKTSPSHPPTNASPVYPYVHEACFELFLSLLGHQALSSSLKEHLVDEVLKVEDGNYVYNYYTLSLLAHTLLLKEDLVDNRLTIRIFERYVDFILEKTNYTCSRCSEPVDFMRCLPSDFHLELVLMSFHLSNDDEKASLIKFLYSSLRKVEPPPSEFNVKQLFVWGLYVSRLLLVLRHVLLYQLSCPTWLIMRLRSRLVEVPNNACNPSLQFSHMSSWVSDVVESILGHYASASSSAVGCLIPHLIDVAPLPSPLCIDNSAVQKIGFDWDDLISVFSSILSFWSGKKANTVDQLILERYIFSLCWDTISANNSVQYPTSLDLFKSQTMDLADVKSFFSFGLVLTRRRADIFEDPDLSEVISNVLVQLRAEQLPDDPSVLDWNFLRKGAWLSLVLFLIRSGLSSVPRISEIPKADLGNAQHNQFSEQLCLREGTLHDMFEGNRAGWLLNSFSLILKVYLQTLQSPFIWSLDSHQSCQDSLSPLLLLKHTKFNLNSPNLESTCGLLSKFDDIISQDTGNERSIMLRCLLHGFPANSDASGAALLSCILIVSDIISLLAEYFEVKDVGESKQLEAGLISQLLGTVMAVKSDKIFQYVHEKCDVIADSLISRDELPGYHDLFVLKQLEGFLREANSKDVIDPGLYEMLVDSVVSSIEALRGDNLKQQVFKFYMGCTEGMPQKAKELLSEQHGDLLILINSLDKCHAETVNVKILNLFVDLLSDELYSHLKEKVQKKFLEMDLLGLSSWLEKRFLGNVSEAAAGDSGTKGVSASVRDSTMNFILSLISQPQEVLSKELHGRLTEAMLMLLDRAFTLCDTQIAKPYFSFALKLLSGESSLKKLLEKIITLMEKLAGSEGLLPGLKVLIGFVGGVLGDVGANKSSSDRVSTNLLTSNSSGQGSAVPKSVILRKNSDNLVLPSNQESGSASVDCDATSADEDDDDGTSDGELGSIEKDEEDESNSERALASKVCTFTSSGNNFMEQHWYFCYTCDLTVSKGCCSICAKVCHRGHRVVYSRSSRFFCDCGAGGVRGSGCQCLKPRKFSGSTNPPTHGPSNYQSFLPFSSNGDQTVDSDSDLDDDILMDGDNCFKLSIPKELQDELPAMLVSLDVEARLLEICNKLLPTVVSRRESNLSKDNKVILGSDKLICYNSDLFQLKKAYKGGSLDLKIKADYPNSRELKSLIASGSITKSLLTVSPRGRLAVGEGDKVAIFDVGQLIGQPTIAPVTADKTNVKPLSKNIIRFEIVHLIFNPIVENYLVVAGLEDCQVLTVNPRGEVTDRLAIELALQGAHICRVDWVPGSQVQLMVVTNKFVKIYDLSQDSISPMHYFTSSDDMIADATLVPAPMGKAYLFVLSQAGKLFRLEVSMEGDAGTRVLTDIIRVPERDGDSKGLSLYFSSTYRLLFLSFEDGNTLMARLDDNAMCLMETSRVYESDQDGKLRPAGLHHWKELMPGSGLFVCLSTLKSNVALSVSMNLHELFAQNLRYGSGSFSFVGIAAYKPLSKDGTYCLVLQDDGSLQIYAHIPVGAENSSSATAEQTKKLGPSILSNKAYAGLKPEFPLDFFERTMCISADVKLSTDAVKNGDSESVKQRLHSDDGFLEASTSTGFKVTATNCNPDIVMVGCRIHVGNTSANHIPSEVAIFQRVVKLDEGMRSWYDLPFTVAESLLADEEFTISVGPTFDGSTMPRIDSLEIYGRAKDEFGWKEKMEALLDMEAHALGSNSVPTGSARKCRTLQSAPIQEQVLADIIKLLSRIYSYGGLYSYLESDDLDEYLEKLRCKSLLETIFQSDREQLLHSSACRVLQAVFPKKDVYYRVKDTMRLLGVVNSFPILVSRIGVGGAAALWVIKEFTSQMHAVSKIAVNRRPNMADFLESHGSEVVDGLMQVLWGILDLERPETQTINSIIIPAVELIYSYAECLALWGNEIQSVVPAVALLKKLLFAPYESVQTSSSLAISSRLLQVPFPKQTMLTTDDTAENPVPVHVPSDVNTNNRSAPVMIEEDSTTSSVQYCCDGCSTVPIIRRRWHCNICPDFDLCEACYEVLDADQLPPPHSRDHPMSAIPIEIDSVGNDGGLHFSMDELNDSSLVQASAEINTHNSSPSIHALETNECGEFPSSAPDQTVVSISASQRALNSLLLRCLIKELSGWMETTSGFRAIPIMQLFYRLSSAVGGPLMDSSKSENLDLEKLVKWLLDEINLHKPFPAKSRSPFGEVAILIFIFFTSMLRSWHQPGSDSSHSKSGNIGEQDKSSVKVPLPPSAAPSSANDPDKDEYASQLIRACSFLRKQDFLNYLMDILQQLVELFKPSVADADSSSSVSPGCGSLLTVRRELPAGNFAPFFSDSYAKAHRSDIFMDYHKLLLEHTFRLVYSLVRPEKQDKSGERDKMYKAHAGKELKLDEFQDVLCSYISNPLTATVRRHARRLLLHLCGSKTQYYSIRDNWQFSNEVKKLYKRVNKSGGFQNPVPYERSVKLVKSLCEMAEVAGARPKNWQKYCIKHVELLPFLLNGIFYFGEESVIQTLKLLNLAFYTGKDIGHTSQRAESLDSGSTSSRSIIQSSDSKKKRKADDGVENGSEKSCLDMEQAVETFSKNDDSVLRHFIDSFLLEWNSSNVRNEAKNVLYGVWYHGRQSFGETLLAALLSKVKDLPMYGQNILEYTELLTWLLGKVPDNTIKNSQTEIVARCLTPEVISCIFETLHLQNELLANHPNSHIYNTLSGLVEFDGYYLESEPCVSCSCPEVPYSRMKLESLKSETKFTDNRIIVKCTGSYTIQSVTMNVHDARKSKTVKFLNLYYNNRTVGDLSELKNNWSLWKRAKSCHLAFNQTELKVEFAIPITACNFMIELDSFYENLQASSLESLQCPRCSRSVTDKHGICGNCHENAYQCRQCRNINYENLDSFLCNECGFSKYGRFEFNFMAKPSFSFDSMENDEDMKKGLSAIESESENAHRRYQQLLGFKKPLLKLVSSIGENEIDSQHKDSVQQLMVSLPGPSCKINRKIALLGVLYGEKCKTAFDSVSKSVQTLQGLRRVLLTYLHQKNSDDVADALRFSVPRSPNNCYGCATTFVTQCLELLQVLSKHTICKKQLVSAGILKELFENNIHQGPKTARVQARAVLCALSEGDAEAVSDLNTLIQKKVMYCLEHHRSMDIALATREELLLLSETCSLVDEHWEARLRVAFRLLFASIKLGGKHPAISEHIILPCLRIISQACTPPRSDSADREQGAGKSTLPQTKTDHSAKPSVNLNTFPNPSKSPAELMEKHWAGVRKGQDVPLLSYSEWERGASYLDFVRRQYKVSQAVKGVAQKARQDSHRSDYIVLKYALKWRRRACMRTTNSDFSRFTLGSWVSELILSACSQSIRSEVCTLVSLICPQNTSRRFQLLNLLMSLLPATLSVGESAAEYFELFFKMIDSEAARLYLTVKGCLTTICKLITQEVCNVESQEMSLSIDISQGFILHKLIELLGKFLEVPNIRVRIMHDKLLSDVLEALLVIRGLVVQKTKLISDCNCLLKELLDSLLHENTGNKWQFIRACVSGLQNHKKERKGRTSLFILEQLCNLICPSKPEPVYLLVLNKAHTQEEFIRGSMTKNPYSSTEIGPLMRDVKNKICHQLDLLGLLEDDYGMELLVAGNIISLDLSISQVYEQVWKKYHSQTQNTLAGASVPSSTGVTSVKDCPPMTVTYRLQGLDGEATEPMIKELEEEREESQDPEVEFAIAGAVRECGGLEVILGMIQNLRDEELKSNKEELGLTLNLLMYCCKIRENRRALLQLGALGLLLETARRAFSIDAMEPAEGILLIVESLTMEANESDIGIDQSVLTVTNEESGAGEQAKKIVLMFLERLCHPLGVKKSSKQQRNNEMVARILPYLTYGQPEAMESLVQHFSPYLQDWREFDRLQQKHHANPKDEDLAQQAAKYRSSLENFVRVSESLKTSSCGERLKDIILEKGITAVAVRHLRESFAIAGQAGFRSSAEWITGLNLPSVPLILSMLRGLSTAHLATQRCIEEEGILPLLHALEGVTGENEIGARAENLLDTLSDKESNGDGFLGEKIHKLRHATKDEMRRLALRRREELLQGLGMRREYANDGGERIVVAQPVIEGLEDVEEEEDGLACMVCREGYTLRPNDMLGVYCYSKRVNLGASSSSSGRSDCVYTTVSHFNVIHFQCHQEAKRADAALRNPKKEWEGATLRNNETLCNCIFPLRGPSVPLSQYTRCVDQYWDNLNALGRADGSRLRLLTYDIVLMLARFATGASFSTDCRGGGRESNSHLLPFMIQMASYLLDQGSSNQQRRAIAKSVAAYISNSSSADSPSRLSSSVTGIRSSGTSDETVQFMMVNSLLSESYEEWLQHRPAFLQRGIYHAYMQHKHGKSSLRLSDSSTSARSDEGSSTDLSDGKKLFAIVQPMLIFTGLIEQLQKFFKFSRAAAAVAPKESTVDGSSGLERWEIMMKEKMVNIKEIVGFSKELLSWLEDMTSATDLQEAFDVMGALADALSGGNSRCEDFVQAAILAAKS